MSKNTEILLHELSAALWVLSAYEDNEIINGVLINYIERIEAVLESEENK